jgi:hypothetical protein
MSDDIIPKPQFTFPSRRVKALTIPCDFCQTLFSRQSWRMKHSKHAYCSRACCYKGQVKRYQTTSPGLTMQLIGNETYKHKGNLGLAHAIAFFARHNYYIFLPIGDNGGAIDLIVSHDGVYVQRVQCKYTTTRQRTTSSSYVVSNVGKQYSKESFDLLYVATPEYTYLIDWKEYCAHRKTLPRNLKLSETMAQYRI